MSYLFNVITGSNRSFPVLAALASGETKKLGKVWDLCTDYTLLSRLSSRGC